MALHFKPKPVIDLSVSSPQTERLVLTSTGDLLDLFAACPCWAVRHGCIRGYDRGEESMIVGGAGQCATTGRP
jgi:hypothetical protein